MPDHRDLGPRLSGRLTYLLKYALSELEQLHETHLGPHDVNVRELAVLLLLSDREPESQQQAAQRLGVDRTTMVSLLDELEAKAMVTRRPDAADRRRNVVELTEHGRKTLQKATRASDQAERQLLADLTRTEAAAVRKALAHLATGEAKG